MVDTRVDTCQRQSLAHNEGKLSLSRLVVFLETSQTLPSVLFFFATANCIQFLTKQDPFVIDVNRTRVQEGSIRISFVYKGNSSSTASERRFRPSPFQGAVRRLRRLLFAVLKFYFFKNLLCAFNSLQPMKNSYFPLRYKLSRVALGAQEVQFRNSWFATT